MYAVTSFGSMPAACAAVKAVVQRVRTCAAPWSDPAGLVYVLQRRTVLPHLLVAPGATNPARHVSRLDSTRTYAAAGQTQMQRTSAGDSPSPDATAKAANPQLPSGATSPAGSRHRLRGLLGAPSHSRRSAWSASRCLRSRQG
jgi:hypothetical protein